MEEEEKEEAKDEILEEEEEVYRTNSFRFPFPHLSEGSLLLHHNNNNNTSIRVRSSGKSFKGLFTKNLSHSSERRLSLLQTIPSSSSSSSTSSSSHSDVIWSVRFSLDGRFLATAGRDRKILIWSMGRPPKIMLNSQNSFPTARSSSAYANYPLEEDSSDNSVSSFATSDHNRNNMRESTASSSSFYQESERKKKKKKDFMAKKAEQQEEEEASLVYKTPYMVFEGHTADIVELTWSISHFLLSASVDKTVRLWSLFRYCTFVFLCLFLSYCLLCIYLFCPYVFVFVFFVLSLSFSSFSFLSICLFLTPSLSNLIYIISLNLFCLIR